MDSSFKKNDQTVKDSFGKFLKKSKRSPNLIEIDKGREFHNSVLQNF